MEIRKGMGNGMRSRLRRELEIGTRNEIVMRLELWLKIALELLFSLFDCFVVE